MWCSFDRISAAAFAALMLAWSGAQGAFWQETLDRAQWQRHAAAGTYLRLDIIRELLERFEEREGTLITIRHPGGDAGTEWAVRFRNRLVAYGIPSRFLELIPGSGGLDILHVSMTDGG